MKGSTGTRYKNLRRQCIRFNFGNKTRTFLQQSKIVGRKSGYEIILYIPDESYLKFAIIDNSAVVIESDIDKSVYVGDAVNIAITKTRQKTLQKPYTDCEVRDSASSDYEYIQVSCV